MRAVREDGPTPANRSMTFADWRLKYLQAATFPHQLNMIDVIENREPRWLHPSMRYEQNDRQMVLINIPPDHAKTVTCTIDYVTYLLCMNPDERIVLVSKTAELASQMLWAIKQRLTHPRYAQLQQDFGPPEGFDSDDAQWQSTKILFPSAIRNPEEKDPTVQIVGIGGQIYGARSTKIFVDDAVLLSNASQYASQKRWLEQDVLSRLGDTGQLIVVGTRVDTVDLYRELRNPDNYEDGVSPWTYLGMPAVLETADDPNDWVTLWPKSDRPWPRSDDLPDEDGLYPRWDGPRLARRRKSIDPRVWSMVYQQMDVSSDAIFDPRDIRACVNGNRTVGRLSANNKHHDRPDGMDGLYVICAMDPAMAGETATVAYAVDPKTLKRYVLEAHRMRAPSPSAIRDIIESWTTKYEPSCWIVEKNAFQLFLTRDEQIRSFLANRGVAMLEHYTGTNKLDPDFGVASLSPLFKERMISLPSSHNSEGVKALIEQLVTWRPGAKGKDLVQDLPLALWFAEIKARQVVEQRTLRAKSHMSSKYVPRYRRGYQNVIHIDDLIQASNAA
ncbi:hypothetical protein [Herbidospora cretacea]|uniref:hypothetical protein n=1 Tax=Herbidospora cretacea TaxID=28444 RepID=UPI000B0C1276|nr:hypothetical protein [Herbidospora cretacea]